VTVTRDALPKFPLPFAIFLRPLGAVVVSIPIFHEIEDDKSAVHPNQPATIPFGGAAFRITGSQSLERFHSRSRLESRSPHNSNPGGPDKSIPTSRRNEASFFNRPRLKFDDWVIELRRLRQKERSDENVLSVAVCPEGRIQNSLV
jgi:hypothetical protein